MADIWQALIGGAVVGLLLSVLIGPVFFALLQTSIEKGFAVGLVFAMGIISGDAFFFLLAYLGVSQIGDTPETREIMGLAGGSFLLAFGIKLLLKKKKKLNMTPAIVLMRKSVFRSYIKGFLLNTLNPAVFLYWIGVVTAVKSQYGSENDLVFTFFLGAMSIVFLTDVMKSYLAFKLKRLVTDNFFLWLNRVSGSVLIIAGIKLVFDAVKMFITT